MLWKRQIPILIVSVIGFLTLFGWFTDQPGMKSFIDDDATQWFDILASFAIFLGGFNLLKLQMQKILTKQSGWEDSLFAVGGLIFAIIAGLLFGDPFGIINTISNLISGVGEQGLAGFICLAILILIYRR